MFRPSTYKFLEDKLAGKISLFKRRRDAECSSHCALSLGARNNQRSHTYLHCSTWPERRDCCCFFFFLRGDGAAAISAALAQVPFLPTYVRTYFVSAATRLLQVVTDTQATGLLPPT